MRKSIISSLFIGVLTFSSCMDLNVEPRNIITEPAVFSSVSGVESYLITCYNHNYVEDFTHDGVRYGWCTLALTSSYCGETVEEEWWTDNKYSNLGSGDFSFWNYNYIREVNYFIETIDQYQSNFSPELINQWKGEALFLRANHYFNMAKRYGGLPLIDHVISLDTAIEEMQIPRSSEYETYKFICKDYEEAAKLLKENTGYTKARASKGAAYGMLSRAALYAGTISKYNSDYTPYDAATQLQGIDEKYANEFFEIAYKAACEVEKLHYSLESNYYEMFGTTKGYDNNEYIMLKEWKHISSEDGNSFVTNSAPRSTELFTGYDIPGFNCPTFDLVQLYEDKNGGPDSRGFYNKMYKNGVNDGGGYIEYNNPADLFANKDARLAQTVILPFSKYYGADIIIRKGLRMSNGNLLDKTDETTLQQAISDGYKVNSFPGYDEQFTVSMVFDPETNTKGKNFERNGAAVASYDGIHSYATPSGFYARKFHDENVPIATLTQRNNETPFPIIRYAEVLLNKAEAAVELGGNNRVDGLKSLNQVRDRAGIRRLTDTEFTVENVRLERQIELALEQHTYWDKKRWRVMHNEWIDRKMKALYPYLDYTKNVYIFKEGTARASLFNGTYDIKWYYSQIPASEINKNPKLVQNYGY